MQQLRERGIYDLPLTGEEFVAHEVFHGYLLYTPTNWEFFGPYAYESDRGGQINCSKGQAKRWRLDDLADTNRTARSRSRSGAAQMPETYR
jgi:hypothetical protein